MKTLFGKVFDHTLHCLKKNECYEVCLTLVSDDEIKKLNKQYRNIDHETDVLTFAYLESGQQTDEERIDLGSIIIAPSVAKKQAKEFKHPYERELAFLFIHGLLHIFGYDHMKEDEAEKMFALQNEILNSLPIDFYTDLSKMKKLLLKAKSQALATYSHFHVGACVCLKNGKYITGFNIENSAYSVCVCAERVALFSAYSQGYTKDDIASIGIISDAKNVGSPCGVCRQAMSELMNMNCPVYIFNTDLSKHLYSTVSELLPNAFTKEDLYS